MSGHNPDKSGAKWFYDRICQSLSRNQFQETNISKLDQQTAEALKTLDSDKTSPWVEKHLNDLAAKLDRLADNFKLEGTKELSEEAAYYVWKYNLWLKGSTTLKSQAYKNFSATVDKHMINSTRKYDQLTEDMRTEAEFPRRVKLESSLQASSQTSAKKSKFPSKSILANMDKANDQTVVPIQENPVNLTIKQDQNGGLSPKNFKIDVQIIETAPQTMNNSFRHGFDSIILNQQPNQSTSSQKPGLFKEPDSIAKYEFFHANKNPVQTQMSAIPSKKNKPSFGNTTCFSSSSDEDPKKGKPAKDQVKTPSLFKNEDKLAKCEEEIEDSLEKSADLKKYLKFPGVKKNSATSAAKDPLKSQTDLKLSKTQNEKAHQTIKEADEKNKPQTNSAHNSEVSTSKQAHRAPEGTQPGPQEGLSSKAEVEVQETADTLAQEHWGLIAFETGPNKQQNAEQLFVGLEFVSESKSDEYSDSASGSRIDNQIPQVHKAEQAEQSQPDTNAAPRKNNLLNPSMSGGIPDAVGSVSNKPLPKSVQNNVEERVGILIVTIKEAESLKPSAEAISKSSDPSVSNATPDAWISAITQGSLFAYVQDSWENLELTRNEVLESQTWQAAESNDSSLSRWLTALAQGSEYAKSIKSINSSARLSNAHQEEELSDKIAPKIIVKSEVLSNNRPGNLESSNNKHTSVVAGPISKHSNNSAEGQASKDMNFKKSKDPIKHEGEKWNKDKTFEEHVPLFSEWLNKATASANEVELKKALKEVVDCAVFYSNDVCTVVGMFSEANTKASMSPQLSVANAYRVKLELFWTKLVEVIYEMKTEALGFEKLKTFLNLQPVLKRILDPKVGVRNINLPQIFINDRLMKLINCVPGVLQGIQLSKDELTELSVIVENKQGGGNSASIFKLILLNQFGSQSNELREIYNSRTYSSEVVKKLYDLVTSSIQLYCMDYFSTVESFRHLVNLLFQMCTIFNRKSSVDLSASDTIKTMLEDYIRRNNIWPVIGLIGASKKFDSKTEDLKQDYAVRFVDRIGNKNDNMGNKDIEIAFDTFFGSGSIKPQLFKDRFAELYGDLSKFLDDCLFAEVGDLKIVNIINQLEKRPDSKSVGRNLIQDHIVELCKALNNMTISIEEAKKIKDNQQIVMRNLGLLQEMLKKLDKKEVSIDPRKTYDNIVEILNQKEMGKIFISNLRSNEILSMKTKEYLMGPNNLESETLAALNRVILFCQTYKHLGALVSSNINLGVLRVRVESELKDKTNDNKTLDEVIHKLMSEFEKIIVKINQGEGVKSDAEELIKITSRKKSVLIELYKIVNTKSDNNDTSNMLSDKDLDNVYTNLAVMDLSYDQTLIATLSELEESLGIPESKRVVKERLDPKSMSKIAKDLAIAVFQAHDLVAHLKKCSKLLKTFSQKTGLHFNNMELGVLNTMKSKGYLDAEVSQLLTSISTLSKLVSIINTQKNTSLAAVISKMSDIKNNDLVLLNIKELELKKISQEFEDSNQSSFIVVQNMIDDSQISFFRSKESEKYDCKFKVNDTDIEFSIEELRRMLINLEQLSKNKTEDMYSKKASDLRQIINDIETSLEILGELRSRGALLNFEKLKKDKQNEISGRDFKVFIKKSDFGVQSLRDLTEQLKQIKTDCAKEEEELLKEPKHHWILQIYGEKKEGLAEYFANDHPNELRDSSLSVLTYLFDEARAKQILNQKLTSQEIVKCWSTTQVLKNLTDAHDKNPPLVEYLEGNIDQKIFLGGYYENKYISLFEYLFDRGIIFSNLTLKQFLFLNNNTSSPEIVSFLYSAFLDPTRHYFIMDLHLLSARLRDELIRGLKSHLKSKTNRKVNVNVLLLVPRTDEMKVYNELEKHKDFIQTYTVSQYNSVKIQKFDFFNTCVKIIKNMGVAIVDSEMPGQGKTHFIRTKARDREAKIAYMILSGEINSNGLNKRLNIVKNKLTKDNILLVKLDMMENMVNNVEVVDQQLFKMCFLKCIGFERGFLQFNELNSTYVELSNNNRDILLDSFPLLQLIQKFFKTSSRSENSQFVMVGKLEFKESYFKFDWDLKIKLNTICKIYDMYKDNKYTKNLMTPDQWQKQQAAIETNDTEYKQGSQVEADKPAEVLMKLFNSVSASNSSVNVSKISMSQVVVLVNTLYKQLEGFENAAIFGGSNPANFTDLNKIRMSIVKLIVKLSVEFATNYVAETRDEASQAKGLRENLKNVEELELSSVAIAREMLSRVPQWDEALKLIIIFMGESMKLVYKDKAQAEELDKELLESIQISNGKTSLNNLKSEQGLIEELIQCFNLVQVLALRHIIAPNNQGSDSDLVKPWLVKQMKEFGDNKSFKLILDNYLKMAMIYSRMAVGLPSVIIGETGCGKTYLVRFLAEVVLCSTFIEMTLHSGVTEEQLEDTIEKALDSAARRDGLKEHNKVIVFFDEFNTSPLQCLIEEIMVARTANFSTKLSERLKITKGKVPANIWFTAACNPLKIKPDSSKFGLIHECMEQVFLHRVFPIPGTLINYSFNYGNLEASSEQQYAESMLKEVNLSADKKVRLIKCIIVSQKYVRENIGASSANLRDIERVRKLIEKLNVFLRPIAEDANKSTPNLVQDFLEELVFTTTIYLTYIIRVGSKENRQRLDQLLIETCKFSENYKKVIEGESFTKAFTWVIDKNCQDLKDAGMFKHTYQLNRPIKENLFGIAVSIITKTPLMIIGKPGSSKTLSVSLMRDFLADKSRKDSSKIYKNFAETFFMEFCGSQQTLSSDILRFAQTCEETAKQFKLAGSEKNVVMVFDELGLAEIGHDNSLKVLHRILDSTEEMKFVFIGISNWRLDMSKMSRALDIPRPDPDREDIQEIFTKIEALEQISAPHRKPFDELLHFVPMAYIEFVKSEGQNGEGTPILAQSTSQQDIVQQNGEATPILTQTNLQQDTVQQNGVYLHPNFFGLRDVYHLSKFIQRHAKAYSLQLFEQLQENANNDNYLRDYWFKFLCIGITRNFSGKQSKSTNGPESLVNSAKAFIHILQKHSQLQHLQIPELKPIDLINQNLIDKGSRHLMIFFSSASIIPKIKDQLTEFFVKDVESYRPEDIIDLKGSDCTIVSETIEKIKGWIEAGCVLIMKDMNEVYPSLYDVLNQKYFHYSEDGSPMAVLHFGSGRKSSLVKIHPRFRIIILMKRVDSIQGRQERIDPPPFLNRCEKHLLSKDDLLDKDQLHYLKSAATEIQNICKDSEPIRFQLHLLVHNYSNEMINTLFIDRMDNTSLIKRNNMEYYFNQVIKQQSVEGNSSMNVESKNQILNAIKEYIVKFYSYNLLLLMFEGNKLIQEKKQAFIKAHPYEELKTLVYALRQNTNKVNKALVFTLSGQLELEESLSGTLKDSCYIVNAESLNGMISDKRIEILTSYFSEKIKVLVINIIGMSSWVMAAELREDINKLTIQNHCCAILLLQYSQGDNSKKKNQADSIVFKAPGWECCVIDDLRGSHYRWLVENLNVDLSKTMVNNQILKEICKDLLLGNVQCCLNSELMQDLISKGDLVRKIVVCLSDRFKSKNLETLHQMISKPEHRDHLRTHFDLLYLIKEVIRTKFYSEIQTILTHIIKKIGFKPLIYALLLSKDYRDVVVRNWMEYFTSELSDLSQNREDQSSKHFYENREKSIEIKLKKIAYVATLQDEMKVIRRDVNTKPEDRRVRFIESFVKLLKEWEDCKMIAISNEDQDKYWKQVELIDAVVHGLILLDKICSTSTEQMSDLRRKLIALASEIIFKFIEENSGYISVSKTQALLIPLAVSEVFAAELDAACSLLQGRKNLEEKDLIEIVSSEQTGICLSSFDNVLYFAELKKKIAGIRSNIEKLNEISKGLLEYGEQFESKHSDASDGTSVSKILELTSQDNRFAYLREDTCKKFCESESLQEFQNDLVSRIVGGISKDRQSSDIPTKILEMCLRCRLFNDNKVAVLKVILDLVKNQPKKFDESFVDTLSMSAPTIRENQKELFVYIRNWNYDQDCSLFWARFSQIDSKTHVDVDRLKAETSKTKFFDFFKYIFLRSDQLSMTLAEFSLFMSCLEALTQEVLRSAPSQDQNFKDMKNELWRYIESLLKTTNSPNHRIIAALISGRLFELSGGDYSHLDYMDESKIRVVHEICPKPEAQYPQNYLKVIGKINQEILMQKKSDLTIESSILNQNDSLFRNALRLLNSQYKESTLSLDMIIIHVALICAVVPGLSLKKLCELFSPEFAIVPIEGSEAILSIVSEIAMRSPITETSDSYTTLRKNFKEYAVRFYDREEHFELAIQNFLSKLAQTNFDHLTSARGTLKSAAEDCSKIDRDSYWQLISERTDNINNKDEFMFWLCAQGLYDITEFQSSRMCNLILKSMRVVPRDVELFRLDAQRKKKLNEVIQLTTTIIKLKENIKTINLLGKVMTRLSRFQKSLAKALKDQDTKICKSALSKMLEKASKDNAVYSYLQGIQPMRLTDCYEELQEVWNNEVEELYRIDEKIFDTENNEMAAEDMGKENNKLRIEKIKNPTSELIYFVANDPDSSKSPDATKMIMPVLIRNLCQAYNKLLKQVSASFESDRLRNLQNASLENQRNFLELREEDLLTFEEDKLDDLYQTIFTRDCTDYTTRVNLRADAELQYKTFMEKYVKVEKLNYINIPDIMQLVEFKNSSNNPMKAVDIFGLIQNLNLETKEVWTRLNRLKNKMMKQQPENLIKLNQKVEEAYKKWAVSGTKIASTESLFGALNGYGITEADYMLRTVQFSDLPLFLIVLKLMYGKDEIPTRKQTRLTETKPSTTLENHLKTLDGESAEIFLKSIDVTLDYLKMIYVVATSENKKSNQSDKLQKPFDKLGKRFTKLEALCERDLKLLFDRKSVQDIKECDLSTIKKVLAEGTSFLEKHSLGSK